MLHFERRELFRSALAAISAAVLPRVLAGQAPSTGVKVAAGRDRFNKSRTIGVSSTTFEVATPDTLGDLFVMEQANTVKGGPPRHLHHDQDEFWYGLEGQYIVEVGTERCEVGPEDCVLGPRGIAHAWAFVGDSQGRLLIVYTPARKMQEWFERDRKKGEYMNDAALYHAFGMELVGPPLSLK